MNADIMRRLAAIEMPAEALREIMQLFSEALEVDEAKELRAARNRRHYQKRLIKTSGIVLETSEGVLNSAENTPEPRVGAFSIGEEVKLKELPTVVTKETELQPANDLFAPDGIADIRKAKRAHDGRVIEFVGEGWNALSREFPRIARVNVIPDRSKREGNILRRTQELLKDFDFSDAENGWRAFFAKIRASPFLRGEAAPSAGRDRAYKPTLDSVIGSEMFLKIMEDQFVQEIPVRKQTNGFQAYR